MARSLLCVATALALVGLAAPTPAEALVRQLDPADGGTGDHLGASVALDGDTLVAGAPGKAGAQGAVYVFTRSAGETWTQSAKLTASDAEGGDLLGSSVAIEGDWIVAGAPGADDDRGAVYVFARTGAATRTETDVLTAGDRAPNDALGAAVDLDGGIVVAGAPGDDVVAGHPESDDANHGSVYTFAVTGVPGRAPTAKLTASDNVTTGWTFGGSALGSSVAIDGDTIVAGAPLDNYGTPSSYAARRGSVYTFASTGAPSRQQTAKLSVSGSAYGRLGVAVDVQGDLVVAGDDDGNDAYGTVYTFARTGAAVRHETGLLRPANPRQNGGFGQSVALSDGFVAVGSPSATAAGGGYVFTRTGAAGRGESWYVAGAVGTGASYGASIATDDDRVVAGAPYVDASEPFVQDRGAVFSSTPDLFVSVVGSGSGTVGSSPAGISACASSCSGSFLLGDQVTLTATPGPGSHFAGWENYAGCTGTGPCVVAMTGAPQVAARFEPGAADTTPPVLAITAGPAAGSTITTGSVGFSFTADETSTFQCAYDAAALAACTSPGPGTAGSSSRTGLAEGAHTFRVRATDLAGNVSAEQTRSFTVDLPAPPPPAPPADTTPPQTRVTQAPPRTVRTAKRRVAVRVGFAASEPARFVCSVDGQAARACSSPARFVLGVGKHTIRVTAIDRAGNRDRSPLKVVVRVVRRR